jgi:hypothetical protein
MEEQHSLHRAVSTGREEAIARPDGSLTVPRRNEILGALGPSEKGADGHACETAGMMRRLRLSELCFEHVRPIWLETIGTDEPDGMLRVAHALLDRKLDWHDAWLRLNEFGTGLQYVYELPPDRFRAAYVGLAAQGTLQIAMDDHWQANPAPDEKRDDWDPYVCSAAAYAHDLPWGQQFRAELSREFWLWMLDVALPVAYEATDRWW